MVLEYRAWHKKVHKMCDVYYVNWKMEEAGICMEDALITVPLETIVLMKNSHRKDISGLEVYEGDFIESHQGTQILNIIMLIIYGTYDAYCPVDNTYMDNIGFYVEAVGYPQMPVGPLEDYAKVIGNIFENDNLLAMEQLN